MNGKGLALGCSLGLVAALMLVVVAGLSGGYAQHIDLVGGGSTPAQQQTTSIVSQVVGSAPTANTGSGPTGQASVQTTETASAQPTPSASGEGVSLAALLSPLVLGVVIGGAFYGLYSRRLDREE